MKINIIFYLLNDFLNWLKAKKKEFKVIVILSTAYGLQNVSFLFLTKNKTNDVVIFFGRKYSVVPNFICVIL